MTDTLDIKAVGKYMAFYFKQVWGDPPRPAAATVEHQVAAYGMQLVAEVERLEAENARLREALTAAKIAHLIVEEDCWYSCLLAKHSDGEWAACYELRDGETRRCTCGADAHNARIDAALTTTEGS